MNQPDFQIGSIFILLFFAISSMAQSHLSCGTDHKSIPEYKFDSKTEFQKYLKFEKEFIKNFNLKSADVDTVYLHHQVVRLNNNTPAVTPEGIEEGLAYLNASFINSNIYFESSEISYIDDNSLFEFVQEDHGDEVIKRLTPGMIDIFYTSTVEIGGNRVGGFAGGSRMVAGSANGPLLTHEMGHIFGLSHTHGKYGFSPPEYGDDVNGFPHQVYIEGAVRYINEQRDDNDNGIYDCYETGDNVCDTPAEYVLSRDVTCYTNGEMMYNGNRRDYFGDLFEPELGNEMSYGCNGFLTPGQYARMRYIFETRLLELQCPRCRECEDDLVVSRSENIGKHSFEWAIACAKIKSNDATKKIIFEVPEVIVEDRIYNILEQDNYSLISKNGKTIIDGSSITDGPKVAFIFEGNNIEIEGIHFKNLVTAMNFSEEQENISIKECIFEEVMNTVRFNEVENLVFNSNEVRSSSGSGVFIMKGKEINILGNNISNADNHGIFISDCEQCVIDSNLIDNSRLHGISIVTSNDVTISSNTIGAQEERPDAIGTGILFSGGNSNEVLIVNNVIKHNRSGLYMLNGEYDRIEIFSNEIIANNTVALNLRVIDRVDITNNLISNNGSSGILITEGRDLVIKENIVNENSGVGLRFADSRNIEFTGNTITNNTSTGTYMEDCREITIGEVSSKNTFSLNDSGLIFSKSRDVTVINNDILENEGNGIRMNFTENTIIGGSSELSNDISKNKSTGISCSDGDGLIIQNNLINENIGSGISFSRTENVLIGKDELSGNIISYNTASGINSFDPDHYQIRGNLIFCNAENGISNYPNNDDLIDEFIIQESNSQFVKGVGQPGLLVEVYSNPNECSSCQFETYLGSSEVDRNGIWQIDISDHEFSFGETVNALMHSEEVSISTRNCQVAEVKVGCFNGIDNLPYEIDFENDELSSFRILGNDFQSISYDQCSGLDDMILKFNGHQPSSEINILYTNSFSLIDIDSASLTFDYAHKGSYSNRQAFMDISISTDCGASYTSLYSKGTFSGLLTEPSFGDYLIDWEPDNCDSWRSETINLNDYVGSDILFKIEGSIQEFFAQNIYLDNFKMEVVESDKCPSRPIIDELPNNITACEGEEITISTGNMTNPHIWSLNGDRLEYGGSDLSIVQSGEYKVIVTGEDECNSEKTIRVLINPDPMLSIDEASTFCENESTELSIVTDANMITWMRDDEIIAEDIVSLYTETAGTYIVSVANEFGCITTTSIELKSNPVPTLTLTGKQIVCENEDAILSIETDATEISWTLDGAEIITNETSITAQVSGNYSATATNAFGCQAASSIGLTINPIPSLEITGENSICDGETAKLELDTDATSVTWYLDDDEYVNDVFNIETEEGGTYSVIAKNEFDCEATSSFDLGKISIDDLDLVLSEELCEGSTATLTSTTVGDKISWYVDNELIVESQQEILIDKAGNYTVEVSSGEKCTAEKSLEVVVRPKPIVEYMIPSPVCVGDTNIVRLETNGEIIGYVSSILDIEITKPTTTFVFIITNEYGCEITEDVSLGFHDLPTVGLSAPESICEGDTTSLNVSTNASMIEWYLNDDLLLTESDEEIRVSAKGTYTVKATNDNGCENIASATLELMECSTPTIEIGETDAVNIYPNPTKDVINVEISESIKGESQYRIYNLLGAIVRSGKLSIGHNQMTLSELSIGSYNIVIENKDDLYVGRFLIADR